MEGKRPLTVSTRGARIVVRPPEAWRTGYVRGRILRAVAKAAATEIGDSEEAWWERDLELVYESDGVAVERWATLESLRSASLAVAPRVFRATEWWETRPGPWRSADLATNTVETTPASWRRKAARLAAQCRNVEASVQQRQGLGRRATEWDPASGEATAALVAALVDGRRWALAADELADRGVLARASQAALPSERAAIAAALRAGCRYDELDLEAEAEACRDASVAASRNDWATVASVLKSIPAHPSLAVGHAAALMRLGDVEAAELGFAAAWEAHPDDLVSKAWAVRCRAFNMGGPPELVEMTDARGPPKPDRDGLNLLARRAAAVAAAACQLDDLVALLEKNRRDFVLLDPHVALLAALDARITADRHRLWAAASHARRARVNGDDYYVRYRDASPPTKESPDQPTPPRTPYDILGVGPDLTRAALRAAYRRRALATHPDKVKDEALANEFLAVQDAYHQLLHLCLDDG